MAVSDKFLNNNVHVGNNLKVAGEVVNLIPVFISTSNTDDWGALKENAYFSDEIGTGRKVAGQRKYFSTLETTAQMIADAMTNASNRYYFDPTTQSAPTTPSGAINQGDVFVVSKDGLWEGVVLNAGDILETPADVVNAPAMSDFLLNKAVSGMTDVPSATAFSEGIVQLSEVLRLDGSAVHSTTLPTEKAIADALIAVRDALYTTVSDVQAALDAGIQSNSASISAQNLRLDDLDAAILAIQTKNTEQDTRLDAVETTVTAIDTRVTTLEEYSWGSIDITVGNSVDSVITKTIAGVEFQNIGAVVIDTKVADGTGGYRRGVILPVELNQDGNNQTVTAAFASPAPTDFYCVTLIGMMRTI